MKVKVLGCNGPFPGAGGACSSYLVMHEDVNILVDMGCGALSNLLKVIEPGKLDAVILSHLHWDHVSDIPVLDYYLRLSKNSNGKPVELFLPGGPPEMNRIISGLKSFEKHRLDKNLHYCKKGIEITTKEMAHPVESYALKFKSDNGSLVYSADTSYNDGLVGFARGCDVILADSAFLRKDQPENPPHMSAYECGTAAGLAKAGSLVLTHLNPEIQETEYLKEATEVFRDVRTASVDMEIEV